MYLALDAADLTLSRRPTYTTGMKYRMVYISRGTVHTTPARDSRLVFTRARTVFSSNDKDFTPNYHLIFPLYQAAVLCLEQTYIKKRERLLRKKSLFTNC